MNFNPLLKIKRIERLDTPSQFHGSTGPAAHQLAPSAQQPAGRLGLQGQGFVAVLAFVLLTFPQQFEQLGLLWLILQLVDLVLVVLVDKGFNRRNGGVHRAWAKQGGQSARGKACHAPAGQQAAALGPRQDGVDSAQVILLGGQVPLGKRMHARVA